MVAKLILLSVSIVQLGAAAPNPQAKAAFDRGERALNQGQLDDAESAYRDALKATPKYPEALNGLGSVLFKKGQREEAIVQFRAAIAADPRFPLAYFNLGFATRRTGDFASAAQAYETYTRLKPEDPDGYYGLGESYRELGQAQKAIAAYEGYIQREKRPSEQKWVDRAKDAIAKLKEPPPQPPAPVATPAPTPTPVPTPTPAPAQPGQAAQPVQPAQPTAETAQSGSVPPGASASTTHSALARAKIAEGDKLMQEKNYREASFAYQDAVNAAPDSVEALFKLGNTYAVLGYYAQAIERWNRVIQASPDASVRKSAEENISKAQARMAQAGGGSPQAAGKQPGSGPVAASTRAQARQAYEQGVRMINGRDYQGALKNLTDAIQLEPSLAVAYIARGSAHIGLRRFNEAVQDYQYASRLDPSLSSPLYGIAESYRALGRNSDARQFYERYAQSSAADVRPELQAQARQKAAQLR